jgi:L-alanine-DL-glutamate epimerase-like enolase superfamily enzyme
MSLEEAIKVGRELERLNYSWYEHPMPEYRVESYVRLGRELSIPILSPEIIAGGVFSRAEWILRGAGDMSRIDVMRGGLTGARKTAIVCEAFGVRCEIHMAGWGNLQVLGATPEDTSEYYEKGLMAPGVDIDAPHPYLAETCDMIDADGYVHLPTLPGLGYDIQWDYIEANLIDPNTQYNRDS